MSATLNAFLRSACEGREASVRVRDLFNVYTAFCDSKRLRPLTRANFGRRLSHHGYQPQRDGQGHTWVAGIGVRSLPGLPRVAHRPVLLLPEGLTGSDIEALSIVVGELAAARKAVDDGAAADDELSPGTLDVAGGEYLSHAGYHRRSDFPAGQPSDSWLLEPEDWQPTKPMDDAVRGCVFGIAAVAYRLRAGERAEG
ncbi:hypothetical protein VY88_27055 [Azospirillum thiophilum]|uniref:Uncharacterized protein n=1 Tax=Azospirillum thiophilum TaxID=528244 RepID=A0AAC8W4W2_9PROT|nr:hypothetical protein [Azospirillum thiophilum]ALG75165.1 hypothetical protein AL072_29965 [Azospirillum thiophilum]KJR62557.1 hypothetical protein VY88_27055 [Azospirillum thiophilum]